LKTGGGITQFGSSSNSGDAFPPRQVQHSAARPPLPVEHGEMQFLVPFALEQGMFTVMRLDPHPERLHQLGGMAAASVASHHQSMNVIVVEGDAEKGPQRFRQIPSAAEGRIDDEPYLALPRRGVRPSQAYMAD